MANVNVCILGKYCLKAANRNDIKSDNQIVFCLFFSVSGNATFIVLCETWP